jgi:4-amino-4-deoxy-L-arabinose transferase-like glycosyltransferase
MVSARPCRTFRARAASARPSLLTASILVLIGQGLLLLLGPMTRAADPLGGTSGLALLAADSDLYLSRSVALSDVAAMPWTRWTYLLLLHVGHLLGDAAQFAVIVQLVATVIAGTLLHHLGTRLAGPVAGVAAAAVLVVNPMTAQWVRFVLTESLAYALIVVLLWSSWQLTRAAQWLLPFVSLFAAAVLMAFLRPNGLLLLGSALTIVVLVSRRGRRLTRAAVVVAIWGSVAAGMLLALDATGQPAEGTLASQLYDGVIVEGAEHVRTVIAMPEPADRADGSNAAAVRYSLDHPLATSRLVVSRIVVESAQVRRHYPLAVNLAFGSAMLLLAATTVAGWSDPRSTPLHAPVVLLGLPLLLLVGLTFAVPEGRYGWAYLVLLSPLAGVGAARILGAATAR